MHGQAPPPSPQSVCPCIVRMAFPLSRELQHLRLANDFRVAAPPPLLFVLPPLLKGRVKIRKLCERKGVG